jgi:SanA protein
LAPLTIKRWQRRILWLLLTCACAVLLAYAKARSEIAAASAGRLYADVAGIPAREVGLVLGNSQVLPNGEPNLFFAYRIEAAAALYQAGKVRYLLASGTTGPGYDEAALMRAALMQRGVPAKAIYCDRAGVTTLDSVVRAQTVFGLDGLLTIVSQGFHNQRAVYLASRHGIDAIGFNARDVPDPHASPALLRERVARLRAWWDVHVSGRAPRVAGTPLRIGESGPNCGRPASA